MFEQILEGFSVKLNANDFIGGCGTGNRHISVFGDGDGYGDGEYYNHRSFGSNVGHGAKYRNM